MYTVVGKALCVCGGGGGGLKLDLGVGNSRALYEALHTIIT